MSRRSRLAVLAAVGMAIALSACSSGSDGYFRRVGGLVAESFSGTGPAPQRALSREELNRIPYATVSVQTDSGQLAYLVAQADNGGYVDYRDGAGNGLRLFGGGVAAWEAAGNDLDAVRFDPDDPVAHPRPLRVWPREVWREYQFSQRNATSHVIALNCRTSVEAAETVVIAEATFNLARVREICTNARRSVENTYWADARTGQIWKSRQWLGPAIGHFTVEVIRPYAK